jgi:hypothetical protein
MTGERMNKSAALSIAVGLLIAGGGYFGYVQSKNIEQLEGELAQLRDERLAADEESKAERDKLSERLDAAEQGRGEEVQRLDAAIKAVGTPPNAKEVAEAIVASAGEALVGAVAYILVSDPDYADALRGKDADPAGVAARIAEGDLFAALVEAVADQVWATRRRDMLSDPELIATVAATVHQKYGAELDGSVKLQAGLAETIARELATEPQFAALVATVIRAAGPTSPEEVQQGQR